MQQEATKNAGVDFAVVCGDLVNKADDTSYQAFVKAKEKLKVPCYMDFASGGSRHPDLAP